MVAWLNLYICIYSLALSLLNHFGFFYLYEVISCRSWACSKIYWSCKDAQSDHLMHFFMDGSTSSQVQSSTIWQMKILYILAPTWCHMPFGQGGIMIAHKRERKKKKKRASWIWQKESLCKTHWTSGHTNTTFVSKPRQYWKNERNREVFMLREEKHRERFTNLDRLTLFFIYIFLLPYTTLSLSLSPSSNIHSWSH